MLRNLIVLVAFASLIAAYSPAQPYQACSGLKLKKPSPSYSLTASDRKALKTATRTCQVRYRSCLSTFIIVQTGEYKALCR